ncbi:GvpL/GvpF family gas vesicle protein [Streptomyces tirandamycinicus]|uniref:GvpL/GvpF family gas vesicle protein n=1 Tax=Streptomyces tirandamycinicus TaxID=2174846 RepID=UPI0022722A0C|nr:GvpL/GvpF family gas vesicle protein [Streptomyces tirandamycinicus]MCY0981176.1 GvpL/GvpF family gas vesicle protein [Streptomyces tirandamycinicus]
MTEVRYVYAVTRPFDGAGATLHAGPRGVAGAPARTLAHDGLLAVLSDVPAEEFSDGALRARLEDLDWLADTARGHDAVVSALNAVITPLPLRLVTVCLDDDGVRRLLDSGREEFTRALERLDGRVEWGVKVYARASEDPPGPPGARDVRADRVAPVDAGHPGARDDGRPQGGRPATGRDYLKQRMRRRDAAEGVWAQADAVSRALHTELSRYAEAERVHRPQDPRLPGAARGNVLNAAYLVPRENGEAFADQVRRLTPPGTGVRVELTGPWAPYSFADTTAVPGIEGGGAK